MATSPFSFPHSSAATYHQPFPFAPPTFPYAAVYPYPPPAPAYASPPGFFQPQHTAHPLSPCPLVHPPPSPTSAFPHPPNLGSTASTPAGPISPTPTSFPAPPTPATFLFFPSSATSSSPRVASPNRIAQIESGATHPPSSLPPAPHRRQARPPGPQPPPKSLPYFPTPAYHAPPCSPPSTPCSTPLPFGSSPHHAYGHGFIPTQASQTAYCPNQPPPLPVPATSEFSGDLSSWSPLCSRPMLQQQKDSPTTSWPEPSPALDLEKSKPSAEAQVRADANISKDMPRAVLDLKRRLDELQARDRTSFDKLRGELAKLTSMAAQLAVSIGKRSISAHTSTLAASAAAPACVVPQVFGELPTPSSGNGTGTTSPAPYASSTAVSVTPQIFGEMPQQYDFQNLSRKTVFRADGTEHSYYALPESYTLEQAIPGPVFDVYDDATEDCSSACVDVSASTLEPLFSSEFVDVFASTPDQQLYEEEQPESEHSNPCLNISSDVRDFTLELQQKNDEKASVNVQQLRAPRLNLLEIDETRKELHTESNSLKYVLQSFSHPPMLRYFFVLRYSNVKHITWLNTVLQSVGDHVECMNPLSLTTPWDPGVLVLHCGITCSNTRITRAAIWSKFSSPTSCELPQSSSVKWRTFHILSNYLNAIFSLRMMQTAKQCLRYCYREVTEDCLADQELMKNTSCRVAALTWHSSVTRTPFLLLNNTNYTWDPGTSASLHSSKGNSCNQVDTYGISTDFGFTISEDTVAIDCYSRPTNTCFSAVTIVHLLLHYSKGNRVGNRETLPWYPVIRTPSSIYFCLRGLIATSVIGKQLSWLQISEPGTWQSQVTNASYAWDPGVKIFLYSWLNILTVWSETTKSLSCTHIPDLAAWRN